MILTWKYFLPIFAKWKEEEWYFDLWALEEAARVMWNCVGGADQSNFAQPFLWQLLTWIEARKFVLNQWMPEHLSENAFRTKTSPFWQRGGKVATIECTSEVLKILPEKKEYFAWLIIGQFAWWTVQIINVVEMRKKEGLLFLESAAAFWIFHLSWCRWEPKDDGKELLYSQQLWPGLLARLGGFLDIFFWLLIAINKKHSLQIRNCRRWEIFSHTWYSFALGQLGDVFIDMSALQWDSLTNDDDQNADPKQTLVLVF